MISKGAYFCIPGFSSIFQIFKFQTFPPKPLLSKHTFQHRKRATGGVVVMTHIVPIVQNLPDCTPVRDVLNLALVCKEWSKVLEYEETWQVLLIRNYPKYATLHYISTTTQHVPASSLFTTSS